MDGLGLQVCRCPGLVLVCAVSGTLFEIQMGCVALPLPLLHAMQLGWAGPIPVLTLKSCLRHFVFVKFSPLGISSFG